MNYPTVIPMLSYEDGIAALEWLARAFGFRERTRMVEPDGKLSHGAMEMGDGVIMLATPTPDYEGPRRHRETCEQARKWLAVPWIIDGVLVYVDDLDTHFERANAAGARILSGIEEDRLAGAIAPKTLRVIAGSFSSEKGDVLTAAVRQRGHCRGRSARLESLPPAELMAPGPRPATCAGASTVCR
ncbi:MAG: VOC family protein [Deltaproteobacteria bacterium]